MPKEIDHIFDQVHSFSQLRRSYYRASRSKGNRDAICQFALNLEENLLKMADELKDGTYTFGPYRSFYVKEPKLRLVESARFQDRVVHHSMHEVLERIYDPEFYEHSYACRTGRGHHAAMLKLRNWLKGNPDRWLLKCDIKKFFPSIDRKILFQIVSRRIVDVDFRACLERLIFSAPGENGIPIGNLTSQLFANVYLNDLDQHIKRQLRVRHYIRYMDDFVLLTETREEALRLKEDIANFLRERLKLELSPHKVMIGICNQGVGFLGFYLTPYQIRLRSSFFRKVKKNINKAQHLELKGCSTRHNKSPLHSALTSYAGHFRFCSNEASLQYFLLEKAQILNF